MNRLVGLGMLCLLLGRGVLGAETPGGEPPAATNCPSVIVVVGAPGEDEYGKSFDTAAGLWEEAGRCAGRAVVLIRPGSGHGTTNLDQLRETIDAQPRDSTEELWIVLLGHGTFDGHDAKFNLEGPDLTAGDLARWLSPFHRPLAIVDCASASGPFVPALSATNRVIVTATQSGSEQNYTRFGECLARTIADPRADLDRDGQTSLLEGFLAAARDVAEFYDSNGRLMTEHALIDDNGDRKGTRADWFRGVRATKKAEGGASPDGWRAHQFHLVRSERERDMPPEVRARRDELELAIAQMRERKERLAEDDYYRQLEALLLELARLYQQADPKP